MKDCRERWNGWSNAGERNAIRVDEALSLGGRAWLAKELLRPIDTNASLLEGNAKEREKERNG